MNYFPLYKSLPYNISIVLISDFLTYREFINITILSKHYHDISINRMKVIKHNNTQLIKYHNPFNFLYIMMEIYTINYNIERIYYSFDWNVLRYSS